MQFEIPRWRNFSVIKNSLISSTAPTHFSSFHSTPTMCQKWKNKWKSDIKGAQESTNVNKLVFITLSNLVKRMQGRTPVIGISSIRYVVRQKRADTKRALKDILFKSGSSKLWDEERMMRAQIGTHLSEKEKSHSYISDKKGQSKFSTRRAEKTHQKKLKRKLRQESCSDDFNDDPERIFKATFVNRWYTRVFISCKESSFKNSTSGFNWREHSSWKNSRFRRLETLSETDSDKDSCYVGSCTDRTVLGLPPTGPLKIEDVKNAFRMSSLKWHPDKHQGPSQARAEEKFKMCASAYKSLCSAFSPAKSVGLWFKSIRSTLTG